MRKILLLLCILSITITAKAGLFWKQWIKGAYYNLKGQKISGLVSWYPPKGSNKKTVYIYFKQDKDAPETKISTDDISAFITDKDDDGMIDSFTISKNPLFEHKPVVQVISSKNDLKLYESDVSALKAQATGIGATGFQSTMVIEATYYYGPNIDNLTVLDKNNFMEIMPKIMVNKPEAVARIKNKKLRFKDIDNLFYFYKYDIMPPAHAPFRDPFEGLKDE
ncbi:hypothetical protein [Mucilaginibacter sp.]|uniref:hypothetical protein n=1 Tax=Mucilaginibacter sp. TaxID=1882438 RepID=UPI00260B1EF9|nr:hypothetical protein [Mucilaginibacter sp.]MDB5128441.1 hypothetical protein [Mucilaginibacter sp.]